MVKCQFCTYGVRMSGWMYTVFVFIVEKPAGEVESFRDTKLGRPEAGQRR